MFKACEFQYDGKSSSDFDLKIVEFSGRGGSGGAELIGIPLNIEETRIKNNPKPFFYGVQVGDKLKFTIQIAHLPDNGLSANENQLTQHTVGAISKWLFKKRYAEFKIIDTDYSNIVYNVIFQNPRRVEVGNGLYGFEIDATCDRPYGYRKQTITRQVVGSATFNIKNLGYTPDYLYPEIQFTASTTFSIKNNADNNTFAFTGLASNETVYINNQREEIISSTGLNRNGNFNFNWFKLTPDYYNSITITGTGSVEFRFEFPMPF